MGEESYSGIGVIKNYDSTKMAGEILLSSDNNTVIGFFGSDVSLIDIKDVKEGKKVKVSYIVKSESDRPWATLVKEA